MRWNFSGFNFNVKNRGAIAPLFFTLYNLGSVTHDYNDGNENTGIKGDGWQCC